MSSKVISLFEHKLSKGHYDFSIDFVGDDFVIRSNNFVSDTVDPTIIACIIADLRLAADELESTMHSCPTEVY